MSAELLMLLGGGAAFILTLFWVRDRDLREKYALLWLGISFMLLLAGMFPETIKGIATSLHLAYASFVLYVALVVIYFFSFGVSVTMTRLYRSNVRLMQELGFLERRVRELEQQQHEASPARTE